MAFPYVANPAWQDDPAGGTELDAAALQQMEDGIKLAGIQGLASTPPASPVDGMLWRYPADATNGVYWLFQYLASATDWLFLGGPPLSHEIVTSETRNNATYGDLATSGPTLTVPFAGDYEVAFGCHITMPASAAERGRAAVKRGAAAISDNDCVAHAAPSSASGQDASVARTIRMAGLAASAVLLMQYRNDAAAGSTAYARRWMKVIPVRFT